MKSVAFLCLSLVLLPVLMFGQTEDRSLPTFKGIHVAEGITLEARKGNSNEISLEFNRIDADQILTEVSNGVLRIRLKRGIHKRGWKIKAKMTYTEDPNVIKVTTGSKAVFTSGISTKDLSIDVTTSGELELRVEATSVRANVTTGSELMLSGLSERLRISATTGSVVDAAGHEAADVQVNASTGSKIALMAIRSLRGTASTGSKINYQGNPALEVKASTGGSFQSIGK